MFTAGKSCIDYIYTLQQFIEQFTHRLLTLKKYTNLFQCLWKSTKQIRTPKRLLNVTQDLYKHNKVSFKLRSRIYDTFTTKGHFQGAPCHQHFKKMP